MSYGWRETADRVAGGLIELCDECGFDTREVTHAPSELDEVFVQMASLLEHPLAGRQPQEGTYSAEQYATHSVEITAELLEFVTRVTDIAEETDIVDLATARAATQRVTTQVTGELRGAVLADVYPFEVSAEWVVLHLLHDLSHHVLDIRRGLAKVAMADLPERYTVER